MARGFGVAASVALSIALLMPSTTAEAGKCCSKPQPASPPNVPNGHGAAAVLNQNTVVGRKNALVRFAQEVRDDKREIDGPYLTTKSVVLPIFDGKWDLDLINQIELVKGKSAGWTLAATELLKRGVTILPKDEEMQALRDLREKGPNLPSINTLASFTRDINFHNEWAQNQIVDRQPANHYGRVEAQDYNAQVDHQVRPTYDNINAPFR